jgi:flavin reductase (DIM6/NTAB) family NADH-FMN oxidoreductase RutF
MSPEAQAAVNAVFHLYDPPVWLVTARDGHRPGGFIATSTTRASILPDLPRMLLAVAKHHHTWGLIETSRTFALHLLASDDIESVRRFGLATGHEVDKFAGLPPGSIADTPNGSPLILGAVCWLDCKVESGMDIGDRITYVAEVTGGAVLRDVPILTVAGLLRKASETDRAEMKRLYEQDQDLDRGAILDWRRVHGSAADSDPANGSSDDDA